MDDLERLANAARDEYRREPSSLDYRPGQLWERVARAVLTELREPSDRAMIAGALIPVEPLYNNGNKVLGTDQANSIFQAMLDSILSRTEGKSE